ncbi:MAG: cobyrinate a,c-diamide synthase [Lachnospiraceae bacterium]|nr:cobyrinate a,c-diamide synthase [Lachnospiraceae bacterium]
MNINRVMIGAVKSGSGKTTITCGLLHMLKGMGLNLMSFKCGPDYIDPMFHSRVLGVDAVNLDTFFSGEEVTKSLFIKHTMGSKDMAVMEGVMGLYDGLSGVRKEGSSYHLAQVTKTPIILVVDTKGMAKSIIPLIAGFLQYDTDKLIKGVILNRMSKSYYGIIKELIENELDIKVIGYVKEDKEIQIGSRHLGLFMPQEMADIRIKLDKISERLKETLDIDEILKISEGASDISAVIDNKKYNNETPAVKIGVAYDEAFCFYYKDNLDMLKEYGGEIVYFSPLRDKAIPNDLGAVIIGGGYPELYLKELEDNKTMRESIKKAYDSGMPVIAECGGFMYLHKAIIDNNGHEYKMADLLDGVCENKGKLVRFGYIELEEKESEFLPAGECIKAHEFHYFDSTCNGEFVVAKKPASNRTYDCVVKKNNSWLGFPHLYYPSNPAFPESIVRKAYLYRNNIIQKN